MAVLGFARGRLEAVPSCAFLLFPLGQWVLVKVPAQDPETAHCRCPFRSECLLWPQAAARTHAPIPARHTGGRVPTPSPAASRAPAAQARMWRGEITTRPGRSRELHV